MSTIKENKIEKTTLKSSKNHSKSDVNKYFHVRQYIPHWNLKEILDFCVSLNLTVNGINGIKREWRAYNYLSKWKPNWYFEISSSSDDAIGIDIVATDQLKNKKTFQVGGYHLKHFKTDYYVQVTEQKIYVHKKKNI